MRRFSLKYTLLTYRLDQLWFPLAFWAFFVVVCLILPADHFEMARAYLGFAIPLVGGVMAAYAILDDPALELRFATPVRAAQILFERTLLVLLVQALCANAYLLFCVFIGVDFAPLGSGPAVQLCWLVPTLALVALGTCGALLGAQTVVGAFLVGLVWFVELIVRDGMLAGQWKYAFIFMGMLLPGHPDLPGNQAALFGLSAVFLFAAWRLLQRQERYI